MYRLWTKETSTATNDKLSLLTILHILLPLN